MDRQASRRGAGHAGGAQVTLKPHRPCTGQDSAGGQGSLLESLQPHARHVHTLTYDNGKEFAHHEAIAEALEAEGFFAHPYHSWERGLNENTNGLIRQYLPKGTDFQSLTRRDIQNIMDKLNNRSRKWGAFPKYDIPD